MPLPKLYRLLLRRGVALVFLLALGGIAAAQESSGSKEEPGLVLLGVVGPRRVLLTREHPRAAKPIVVILENRGAQSEIIPDLARLQGLVALEVLSSGQAANWRPVLIPPKRFPITLQPKQKYVVVFSVAFDRADSSAGVAAFHYAATLNRRSLASTSPSTSAGPSLSIVASASPVAAPNARGSSLAASGPDLGASVTATPLQVGLKKDAAMSEPITFTAKWDRSFFVSGWEGMPADPVADADFDNAGNARTARARWKNPGDYTVKAYLIHFDSPGHFISAEPTVDVHVIKVMITDDMGNELSDDPSGALRVGVTTTGRAVIDPTDRSQTLKARVIPASQVDKVNLQVGSGASRLKVFGQTPSGDSITFKVEGIGDRGSDAKGDSTVEAKVSGTKIATATISVIVPFELNQSLNPTRRVYNVLVHGAGFDHAGQAVGGSSPAWNGAPAYPYVWLFTAYDFVVTVTVVDRFGDRVGDAKLYRNAAIEEKFASGAGFQPPVFINLRLNSNSEYLDPVGWYAWDPASRSEDYASAAATNFLSGTTRWPIADLPPPGKTRTVNIKRAVLVGGFELNNLANRDLIINPDGTMQLIIK